MKRLLALVLAVVAFWGCQQMGSALTTGGYGASTESTPTRTEATAEEDETPAAAAPTPEESGPASPPIAQANPTLIEPKSDQGEVQKTGTVRMSRGPDFTIFGTRAQPISMEKGQPLDLELLIEVLSREERPGGRLKWKPAPPGGQVRIVFVPDGSTAEDSRQMNAVIRDVSDEGSNASFTGLELDQGRLDVYYIGKMLLISETSGDLGEDYEIATRRVGSYHIIPYLRYDPDRNSGEVQLYELPEPRQFRPDAKPLKPGIQGAPGDPEGLRRQPLVKTVVPDRK